MLTLNDLVTDPPPDAVICSTCRGYGVVVAWTSCPDIMQTSEDCSQCAGKGWIKKMKRIPKWLQRIAIFCELVQESGHTFFGFARELVDNEVNQDHWDEAIRDTWFILQGDRHAKRGSDKFWKIIFEASNQWECVQSKIPGEILSAHYLINLVLSDPFYMPDKAYEEEEE